MLNYIKSECYRVMHSRSTYVMTGIMAVLPVLFHIILYVTGVASSTTQDFPYDITSFSFSFLAGSPMLFTYAGLIVAPVSSASPGMLSFLGVVPFARTIFFAS